MSKDRGSPEFMARRDAARRRLGELDGQLSPDESGRREFFEAVYGRAEGDAAAVPWADLEPKREIAEWLSDNPGGGRTAIDVACGLGDHAEAMSAAGYQTAAFDLSRQAVDWARQRFPDSTVDYRAANLLELPADWQSGFDLVNECYTIQSVPPPMHDGFAAAIAGLVKPGGTLLIYARVRPQGGQHEGPPWPLMPSEYGVFERFGLTLRQEKLFDVERTDRRIAHVFCVWEKTWEGRNPELFGRS